MDVSKAKGRHIVLSPDRGTIAKTPPTVVANPDAPVTHLVAGLTKHLAKITPKTNSVTLMGPDAVEKKLVDLANKGVHVETIGASREGRPISALRVGHGPKTIVAIAGAHPDEPVGTVTCLHLAEKLATDPSLRTLLDDATFHFVPMANPDGSAKNEHWFSKWGRKPDIGAYLTNVRRDAPKDDVEFGFPGDAHQEVRPENKAIAGWFDSIGTIDHYVSLHSMFLGGGALFLVMGDLDEHLPKIRFVQDQIDGKGLPLHDKDRFGQKGFHRLGPGLQTAPTKEDMAAFFAAGDAKDVAAQFRLNSMQYVAQFCDCPLAFVSEIPLCYDKRIGSMVPIDRRRDAEELRFADSIDATLKEAAQWGTRMAEAGVPDQDVEAFGAGLRSGHAAVDAMRGDVERYGDAPATEGNVLENNLNVLRRRAALAGKARAILERSGLGDHEFSHELDAVLTGALDTIRSDFKLKHPSLEAQVDLQSACVLAGLVERATK